MTVSFRKAVPADAPAIARLLTDSWRQAYRGILSDGYLSAIDADKRCERILATMETCPEFRYSVLEADGELAGVSGTGASRDEDLPDAAEIVVFYIRPDLQGRGLGKLLMRETLAFLYEVPPPCVALWVLKDNHAARAFYEAMGFVPDGAEKILPNLENAATVRYRYTKEGKP